MHMPRGLFVVAAALCSSVALCWQFLKLHSLRPSGGTLEVLRGTEITWQKPPLFVKAVLFVAHGCGHSALDFFDRSKTCQQCIGLPEEKAVVKHALEAGFLVIAASSKDRAGTRCWSVKTPGQDDDDGAAVRRAIHTIVERELPRQKLPLFAFGASSGGSFVQTLPLYAPEMVAVVAQIAPGLTVISPEGFRMPPSKTPTAFSHMPRDASTAKKIRGAVKTLKQLHIATEEWEAHPLPVPDTFFAERIEAVQGDQSMALVQALRKGGIIDLNTEMLRTDPRDGRWRHALRNDPAASQVIAELGDSLVADESPIAEELNVAWATHELSAAHMPQILAWLMMQGKAGG